MPIIAPLVIVCPPVGCFRRVHPPEENLAINNVKQADNSSTTKRITRGAVDTMACKSTKQPTAKEDKPMKDLQEKTVTKQCRQTEFVINTKRVGILRQIIPNNNNKTGFTAQFCVKTCTSNQSGKDNWEEINYPSSGSDFDSTFYSWARRNNSESDDDEVTLPGMVFWNDENKNKDIKDEVDFAQF